MLTVPTVCSDEPYQAQSPKGHYRYFFNFCGHAKGCYSQPSCQVTCPLTPKRRAEPARAATPLLMSLPSLHRRSSLIGAQPRTLELLYRTPPLRVQQVRIREDGKEEIATVTTTGELYKMKWEKLAAKDFTHMESIGVGRFTDGVKVTYSIGPMQRSTTILVPCLDKNSDYGGGQSCRLYCRGPHTALHLGLSLETRL